MTTTRVQMYHRNKIFVLNRKCLLVLGNCTNGPRKNSFFPNDEKVIGFQGVFNSVEIDTEEAEKWNDVIIHTQRIMSIFF